MATRIIDGMAIAKELLAGLKREASSLSRRPGLAAVLVGERVDSMKYVRLKQEAAAKLGYHSEVHTLPEDATQMEVAETVSNLNKKSSIDGIIVQLPLPEHLNSKDILSIISPEKDVDGFHPLNVGKLTRIGEELRQDSDKPYFNAYSILNAPCTPLGCLELLDRANIEIAGKHAVVLGRSNIVGLPMATMLLHRDATVTTCHRQSYNVKEICLTADILIAACGRPQMVRGDWIKKGAVVIDVGITYLPDSNGLLKPWGDVCFDEVVNVASVLTKVPGGVGPMTVAMLMRNTLANCKKRQKA